MPLKRAAITGIGAVTPLGYGANELFRGILEHRCATRRMPEWDDYETLRSKVAAPIEMQNAKAIPRQFRRTMSPMSIFSVQAADEALRDAGIDNESLAGDPRCGCVTGHTTGSPQTINTTYETLAGSHNLELLTSASFFHCLSHTVSLNLAQYLNLTGVVMATSAACASGLQAIGAALDLIRLGRQDVVICGGGEELHPTVTGSFDILFASSTNYNDSPSSTPRPFDRDRDGLVCGEGAGIIVLEEYERARRRGAPIYAEVLGYHSCGNGAHVSQSSQETMVLCMREAMTQAGLQASDIGYINAHATATEQGDIAEAAAIAEIFSDQTPVSSLKGYTGHTLGASGAIELIATLLMTRNQQLPATMHLDNIDPRCESIQHLREHKQAEVKYFLKNSFAFGGINAALVCGETAP